MQDENILVWLPSPMGDTVLCTPALRAIRRQFASAKIFFFGNSVVRQILSPCPFCDSWLEQENSNPFAIARLLKKHNFSRAVLFKNSFASALAVFLSAIPCRTGYSRQGRGLLLSEKLYPPKLSTGKFKPLSMVDYYLAIASWMGAETADRKPELSVAGAELEKIKTALPEITQAKGPIVALVPGGAFGPSKCWLSERFAQLADKLADEFDAKVFVSVSPAEAEQKTANQICDSGKSEIINLGERALTLGELKAFFSLTDLVICNDTGPRHIAVALGRKVVSLFGPNDPVWTDTGYENEIQIVSDIDCAGCQKAVCPKEERICMESITVETVYEAAKKLLERSSNPSL